MNWELIAWFAGVVATLYGLKFVIVLFRTLFSKQTMVRVIDSAGRGAANTADRVTEKLREKVEERRERKQREKEENKPVVIIR